MLSMISLTRKIPQTFGARMKYRWFEEDFLIQPVATPDFSFYIVLPKLCGRQGDYLQMLARCSVTGKTMLIPPQFAHRDILSGCEYSPLRLRPRLFLEAAVRYCRALSAAPYEIQPVLYDPGGLFAAQAEPFARLASTVRVVTQRPDSYEETADRLLSEYGVSLVISENPASLSAGNIVIAPEKAPDESYLNRSSIVFSPEFVSRRCHAVSHVLPRAPAAAEQYRPPDISAELFASALFEICRYPSDISRLNLLIAVNNRITSPQNAANSVPMLDRIPQF